jgi:acetoin utilization protein AcuC
MSASTIGSVNLLPEHEKREIYRRIVPTELLERFNLTPYLTDIQGRSLLKLKCPSGSTGVEMSLYHEYGFPDPVLYGHLTDTMNGQIHILLYVLNDPASPRFDVDLMPDGQPTKFGTFRRNIQAERDALQFGLAPGQIRKGLGLLAAATNAFERFVQSLGHDMYFAEPLYYHNAIIFERYGFAYQSGKKRMEEIQAKFTRDTAFVKKLDNSSVFRQAKAKESIRLRSWAIHDGILGEPFTNVTMYKQIGKTAGINTSEGCRW